MPQPAGVTVQFNVASLPPLLLIAADIAAELPPSTTVVEAGGVSVTVIGFVVKVMVFILLELMVEPAVIVAVHDDARVAAGGV